MKFFYHNSKITLKQFNKVIWARKVGMIYDFK
ncbi:hypothetical protein SERP0393 [Staphylococcus epidermidis RP62A]|uniref:Uncharacterized protein n=1 Tax=Staphylococcus epidermidis (strain ATCC 35984 / DSM 28319 / BCRC 17069 / CCUG 31568 / BM 3577 / RP62A) TaxID=176279 RepID=Q5HR03_STAEQ|nr:hypothetical protein SERP0393 [Staphylococcus epidermidis RP62A]